MFEIAYVIKKSDPPPLPLTHPPPPFGSGMSPRGTPMKFTTFHQHHHQLVAHPQFTPPINGVSNGNNNFQTQTIHVVNQQQHFVAPQQMQHHHQQQQQQFYDYNQPVATSNYVSNNTYSRMSAPLGMTLSQQQLTPQRPPQFWNQQQQQYAMRNEFNGNNNNESG